MVLLQSLALPLKKPDAVAQTEEEEVSLAEGEEKRLELLLGLSATLKVAMIE